MTTSSTSRQANKQQVNRYAPVIDEIIPKLSDAEHPVGHATTIREGLRGTAKLWWSHPSTFVKVHQHLD